MMQREKFKTIEAAIARTVSTLVRSDIKSSYTDRLVIELLGDEDSSAYSLIRILAGEHGVAVIMRGIVRSLSAMPHPQISSPAEHFDAMRYTLMTMLSSERLTAAHILYAAAFDTTTATSAALRNYGIAPSDILLEIRRMANTEYIEAV